MFTPFVANPPSLAGSFHSRTSRAEPGVADLSAALSEGVDVAVDFGGTFDGAARDAQEVEVYGQEELAHDLQVRLGKQNMDVRHAAGNRILDRDAKRRWTHWQSLGSGRVGSRPGNGTPTLDHLSAAAEGAR